MGGILVGALSVGLVASLGAGLGGFATAPTASDPTPSASPQPSVSTKNLGNAQIIADVAQASLGQDVIFQKCYLPAVGEAKSGGSVVYVLTDPESGGMWFEDQEDDKATTRAGYPTGESAWIGLDTAQEWNAVLQTAELTDIPAPNPKEAKQILREAGAQGATWVKFPEDGSVIYGTKPTAEYGYLMRGMQMLSGAYQSIFPQQPSASAAPTPAPSPSPSAAPLAETTFTKNDNGFSTLTVTPGTEGALPTVITIGDDGLVSNVKNDPGLSCDFSYTSTMEGTRLMKPPAGTFVTWETLKPALTAYAERKRAAGETNTTPVGEPITVKVGEDGQVEVQSPAASPEASPAGPDAPAGPQPQTSAEPVGSPQPSPSAS